MESELQLLCQCLNANHDDRKNFDKKFTAYYQKIAGTPNNPSKFFNWLIQCTRKNSAGGVAEELLHQTINKILIQLRDRPNIALRLHNNIFELNIDFIDIDIQKQKTKNWMKEVSIWINNIMSFYPDYSEIDDEKLTEIAKKYNDEVEPLQANGATKLIEVHPVSSGIKESLDIDINKIKQMSLKKQATYLYKQIAKQKKQRGIIELSCELDIASHKSSINSIEKLLKYPGLQSIPSKEKEIIKVLGEIKLVEEIKLTEKAKSSHIVFIAEVEDILIKAPEFRIPLLTWVIEKKEKENFGGFETIENRCFIDSISKMLKNVQLRSVSPKQKDIIEKLEMIELVKGVGKIVDVVYIKKVEDILKESPEYRIPLLAWIIEKKGKAKLEENEVFIDLMGYILTHASDLRIPLKSYKYKIAKNSVLDYLEKESTKNENIEFTLEKSGKECQENKRNTEQLELNQDVSDFLITAQFNQSGQSNDSIEFLEAAATFLMKPVNESREAWESASYAQEKARAKNRYEKSKLEYAQCCSVIEYLDTGHNKTEIAEIMQLPYGRVLNLIGKIQTLLTPLNVDKGVTNYE